MRTTPDAFNLAVQKIGRKETIIQYHQGLPSSGKRRKSLLYIKAKSTFCPLLSFMNDLLKLALISEQGTISRVSECECRKCEKVKPLVSDVFFSRLLSNKSISAWNLKQGSGRNDQTTTFSSVLWKTSKPINVIPKERGETGNGWLRQTSSSAFFSCLTSLLSHSTQQLADNTEAVHHSRRQSCFVVNPGYLLAKGWITLHQPVTPNTNVLGRLLNKWSARELHREAPWSPFSRTR